MAKILKLRNEADAILQQNSIDEIYLDNVTVKGSSKEAILQAVDIRLPMDETLIVESSNPQNAVYFLQLLAGRLNCDSGRILWNGQNVFSNENEIDLKPILSCYFENHMCDRQKTVAVVLSPLQKNMNNYDILDQFELQDIQDIQIKNLSYEMQKIIFLIQAVAQIAQVLILEDPAMGLSEFNWLQFMDLVQYQQRRGFLRHIYMTNHHPTALRHLSYNKIFLEEGLIYFDENAGYKKASHF